MSFLIDFSLLRRNRDYRLLFTGQFVSFIGTMITGVVLPYQIYHITQSVLLVGLLSLFQLLPLLATALLGGVLADRCNRRLLLLTTETLIAIGCLLLALNASLAEPKIWIIFTVAVLMSAVNGLHRPALDSIAQQLVAKKDYSTLGSLITFKSSVGMIGGPAVGGLIIAKYGITTAYLVDLATFAISLTALLLMHKIPDPDVVHQESTWTSLKQGFKFAFSRQALVGSYLVDFVAMVFSMPIVLFPAIAEMHGGASVLGFLYAAPATGALIISFFSGWAKHIKYYGIAIACSAALWGIAITFFGIFLSFSFWISLFFLALAGAFDAISGVFRSTLWNETIPTNYRGRLAGIEMISYLSGPKLGDTETSLVAAAFGITTSIVFGGILCVISVAACCYLLPKFRQYRSEIT